VAHSKKSVSTKISKEIAPLQQEFPIWSVMQNMNQLDIRSRNRTKKSDSTQKLRLRNPGTLESCCKFVTELYLAKSNAVMITCSSLSELQALFAVKQNWQKIINCRLQANQSITKKGPQRHSKKGGGGQWLICFIIISTTGINFVDRTFCSLLQRRFACHADF